MQINKLKSIVVLTSASLLLAMLAPVGPMPAPTASAQSTATGVDQTSKQARRLEGVWDSQINFVNPQNGATILSFRGLSMFIQGGSLNATNNLPNAPLTIGPSVGHWEYLGKRQYVARFRFFLFNTDGSPAGSQRVTRTLTLDKGSQTFTGTVSTDILDTSDNVVQSASGQETSVRVE